MIFLYILAAYLGIGLSIVFVFTGYLLYICIKNEIPIKYTGFGKAAIGILFWPIILIAFLRK